MNLRESLRGVLTEKEMQKLVTSFDIIGDIAIIEIPYGLGKKQKKIGEALMKIHKYVKVVAKKMGPMSGEFRVRPLKVISGEKRTETEYKESNCRMKFDVSEVYFSVRLSHERERIAELVKDGEKILALFAGVGPFPLVIARKKPNVKIIAIELNPKAVKYLKENIKLNKFENRIQAIEGDVNKILSSRLKTTSVFSALPKPYRSGPSGLKTSKTTSVFSALPESYGSRPSGLVGWADRVLMPLPKGAENFLVSAIRGVKNKGIIHFYRFVNADNACQKPPIKINGTGVFDRCDSTSRITGFEEAEEMIRKAAKKAKVRYKIISKKIIRSYSPKTVQVVLDVKIQK